MNVIQETLDIDKYLNYDELKTKALSCTKCELCKTRKNVVFSSGPSNAKIMVIGEAPGADEDESGFPFVGRSGQMMRKLFGEVRINEDEIYIANVLKCRPPENRNPKALEIEQCKEYLDEQIKFVNPKVIVPVGNFSARFVLQTKLGIMSLRKQQYEVNSRFVVPTVHPAYVLRNGVRGQNEMLQDLKIVKDILDKEV